ncbi:hypothetical protein OROMI_025136 [Orobanche minor]
MKFNIRNPTTGFQKLEIEEDQKLWDKKGKNGIFGSSRTIFEVIPDCVEEECMLLKFPITQQDNKGGNIHFMIQTSMIKEQCSGSLPYFGSSFSTYKSFLCPTTCLLPGPEEDSHRLPGSKWSSLPFLILWMIKDRLDFFDNGGVALVCRHWWQASINYPTKLRTVGNGIPWIMLNAGGNKKCFINAERTKKFVVEMPEFYDSHPLFSRKGWILLRREKVCTCTDGLIKDSLLLINPLTKGKIELRDVVIDDSEGGEYRLHKGCFSNGEDGFPNCVVICYMDPQDKDEMRLYITYLGGGSDQVWTRQSYVVKVAKFYVFKAGPTVISSRDVQGMTVINSHVYINCQYGAMIIYDMSRQIWKEIECPLNDLPWISSFCLMELEGGVGIFGEICSERWFFKYNLTHNCWQRLANEDDEANSLMLFGGHYYNYLAVRIQKRSFSTYTIIHKMTGKCYLYHMDYLLGEGTKFTISWEALWVDIGYPYVVKKTTIFVSSGMLLGYRYIMSD